MRSAIFKTAALTGALLLMAAAPNDETPPMKYSGRLFPVTLRPEAVYAFEKMDIEFNRFHIETGPGSVVPIETSAGVAGVVLLAPGRFVYRLRNGVTRIEGRFHAITLRFSPLDYERVVPALRGSVAERDPGAVELAKAILARTFDRCFAEKDRARMVPRGALVANPFSKEYGDLLILDNGREAAAVSYTRGRRLFGPDPATLEPPITAPDEKESRKR